MTPFSSRAACACVAALSLFAGATSLQAASVNISTGAFASSASPVGSFTGVVDYNPVGAKLTVTLTNTSTSALNIVGFGFNYPNAIVDHLTLASVPAAPANIWEVTGPGAAANPFDDLDALVSTDGSFNGGGNGDGGVLPNGGTGTWVLNVLLKPGHTAGELSTMSFLSEAESKKDQFFVVRFQGEAGSNKYGSEIDRTPPVVPVPAAVWAGGSLLAALGLKRFFRRV